MTNKTIVENILKSASSAHQNLTPAELVSHAIINGEGKLTDTGALMADTGEFTGRSPKDKFCVVDSKTENTVWWGDVNNRFESDKFEKLMNKVIAHYAGKKVYMRNAYACADPHYRLNVTVVNETAYHNLFCNNLFLRPEASELASFETEWLILNAPSFKAVAAEDGTRQHNFSIIDFSRKIILVGGSGYTGEMKKGIFTVLNYVLPQERNTLSMHCSANIGKNGDTAVFFGLSGTGKTTLSADPDRKLIGDDEHGWAEDSVFNFEGGCYAKCVDLTKEKEPQIFDAIRFGSLVENTRFIPGTSTVDYANISVTENTRAAYPIDLIDNIAVPSVGKTPENIFFLTADAFGVLPPISKLNVGQAMYSFISGYTAKVAGTEAGVTEPSATFSACFGKAFLSLHPTQYGQELVKKMEQHYATAYMVNTGWNGSGKRISIKDTRAIIDAICIR
jgi:phosphoenolpyruvate carboxykinase (ATP)